MKPIATTPVLHPHTDCMFGHITDWCVPVRHFWLCHDLIASLFNLTPVIGDNHSLIANSYRLQGKIWREPVPGKICVALADPHFRTVSGQARLQVNKVVIDIFDHLYAFLYPITHAYGTVYGTVEMWTV